MTRTAFFLFIFSISELCAQGGGISGTVLDARTRKPLREVLLQIHAGGPRCYTDLQGRFSLSFPPGMDTVACEFSLQGYVSRTFSSLKVVPPLEMGVIYLEPDIPDEMTENLIALEDTDLFEEEDYDTGSGFLQASRDVFLSRAAFDFSPAFFRVRGYDSRNASVYLNGIPMNRVYDGRPQWNNWGGLNDVSRNQLFLPGMDPAPPGFGGLQGTSLIEVSPGVLREGYRLTLSGSNRSYRGRLMLTYNSGIRERGWGWLFSVSRRLARQGYMEGTPYNASSFLAGVSYRPSERHEFTALGIYASNQRGRSSALTPEALELGGRDYNPYWGVQDGKIRNSRMRYIREPLVNLRYRFRGRRSGYTLSAAYQWGTQYRTRLGYYNAPNPDPVYYRNLPSYYLNSPIGPNLLSGEGARLGFMAAPQIDWGQLYDTNRMAPSGKAAYLLLSDRNEETLFTLNAFGNWDAGQHWTLNGAGFYQSSKTRNYSRLEDLLGAEFHLDSDPFSQTRNDLEGAPEKGEGDRFGYDYEIAARRWEATATLQAEYDQWSAFLAGYVGNTTFQRHGFYRNERYPNDSRGPGEPLSFLTRGLKGGFSYRLTGRHWIRSRGSLMHRPPVVRNLYINPRDRGHPVPDLRTEKVMAADLSYYFRGMALSSRITAFYTRMMHLPQVNFFFTDSGYGSAFVQEVVTGVDWLHKGLEMGLEYELSPSVQLTAALGLGDYRYASQPEVSLYFLPGKDPGDILQKEGRLSAGPAEIKGLKRASGPSRAVSLGINYRDPAYWWAGITVNHMAGQYPALPFLRYTKSFLRDPETGRRVTGVTPDEMERALRQSPLPPVYLLNLVGGKSWRRDSWYISLFLGVSNLLDAFFLSGGYEQGRNGNYSQWYQDQLGGRPSFGPKFWPGFGRTFFINLSWSFK